MGGYLLHDTAVWTGIAIILVVIAVGCIRWLAAQPFFGGKIKPKEAMSLICWLFHRRWHTEYPRYIGGYSKCAKCGRTLGVSDDDVLTEHYIHGDITTEEYEDRRSHPRFT